MLYPNLQINISKKRGASGLDESDQLITTPVILDMAVQMSDEKNSFAFSHQPTLNQLKQERLSENDKQQISLQTPILDINQTPFFNQSTTISPNDTINGFVAPNDILNTFTTASSSNSTSTTTNVNLSSLPINANTYNDLNQQTNHLNLNVLPTNKQDNIHQQNNYHDFAITSAAYNTSNQQLNQYTSGINLNHHQTANLNDNILIGSHPIHPLSNHDQQQNLTYTELKPSNQQLLIPNSVYDISGGYNKKQQLQQQLQQHQPLNYLSPESPTSSLSSQTSSSNLDNQDNLYLQQNSCYGESSVSSHHLNRSTRRFQAGQSSNLNEKKSRMTKKQKYDAMINEEKSLLKNNEQLKNDIKELEDQIVRYKQTIMNTVKNNRNN